MKTKGGRKEKPQLYGHIASAIIPVASIVAVPLAAQHFPQQKTTGGDEWGPLASTLLRASFTGQRLVPSTSPMSSLHYEDDEEDERTSKRRTPIGRIDASSDEDDSDEESRSQRATSQKSVIRSSASRTASLSDAQRRMFGQIAADEESMTTTHDPGLSSTIHLDPKQALAAELSRSTTTTTTEDKNLKRATVTITRQHVPPLVLSSAGPTQARPSSQVDSVGIEGKSLGSTTARSSLNESTTIPMSARSVSFKEPVIYEAYDPPSSKSQQSTVVTVSRHDSVLEKLVIPPPEEYQHDSHELEKRLQLLNDENQKLRSNNRNLQKQQEELMNRLQSSQKLSKQELNDLLRKAGHDQTKDLENLNQTLQNRCEQLQNELTSLRERYNQDQGSSSARELKNENHFLKDQIHRLNVQFIDYQKSHPPDVLKDDLHKELQKLRSLPLKGPTPIWLLNQKFLAPLFLSYDEKLRQNKEFIEKLQTQLRELQDQTKSIANENLSLHERLARTSSSPVNQNLTHLSDLENIKRHAYLVLEENKVLQEQLDLQTNRLTEVQRAQIEEASNLTRRLMVLESEKSEGDRTIETLRIRNEELRRKYEQIIIDNGRRVDFDEHMRELSETKRFTDELSEKHASEMQFLLRRVKDAEVAKKNASTKLTESRSDLERLKTDMKDTRKANQKLQTRVQTYQNKLEFQEMKEQQLKIAYEKMNEDIERLKSEQENYAILAKAKEDEANRAKEQLRENLQKMVVAENRLENQKSKNKERVGEVQEQTKKQYENLKIRCSEHENRIEQLLTLLNDRQYLIDDLNSQKRNLEADLEQIWLTTTADNRRMQEQLHEMRVTS